MFTVRTPLVYSIVCYFGTMSMIVHGFAIVYGMVQSIGLVLSEEKIFEKVYDVRRRRTPSDGNSSHDPLGQVS
jgi:hypothetical protein